MSKMRGTGMGEIGNKAVYKMKLRDIGTGNNANILTLEVLHDFQ